MLLFSVVWFSLRVGENTKTHRHVTFETSNSNCPPSSLSADCAQADLVLALWLPLAQQLHRCLAAGRGARLDDMQRAAAVDLLRVTLWVAASPAAVDGKQRQQQQAKWQAAAEAWCKLADAVARSPPRGVDGAKHAESLWASLAVAALQRIDNARCPALGGAQLFSRAAAKLCEMVREDGLEVMVRNPLPLHKPPFAHCAASSYHNAAP